MKEAINTLIKTFSEYILKPKPVYKYIARIVIITLLTELASVFLPEELKINYVTIRNDYGLLAALLFSIFIGAPFIIKINIFIIFIIIANINHSLINLPSLI
jgi:hypothetical protein